MAALEHFLRTEVEPLYDPDAILKCQPGFAFDQIGSLHFCSFTVLRGDAEFPPYLVFEATFDGSVQALTPVGNAFAHFLVL